MKLFEYVVGGILLAAVVLGIIYHREAAEILVTLYRSFRY